MKKIKEIFEVFVSKIITYYIILVYKTSKINITGCYDLVHDNNEEKFVVGLWHGESHCCYPILKDTDTYMVTTTNRRGAYISRVGKDFGYIPLRLPDESEGKNHIFKIRSTINGEEKHNLALALDGPSGPYHQTQKFVLLTTLLAKRRMVLVKFEIKGKIQLNNRWDKYILPLPFCKVNVHFHEPIEIKKVEIDTIGEKIADIMEKHYK